MIRAEAKHLNELLKRICQSKKQPLTRKGLSNVGATIGLAEDYLYKSIYYPIVLKKKRAVSLNEELVSKVVKAIDYDTYIEFVESMDSPMDPVLAKTEGVYRSYVRMNSEEGAVLCSPVEIKVEKNVARFELRGKHWTYAGDVELESGCLFITMRTSNGKSFHHVYKIGKASQPRVLLGVFSGVSSNFDPIGGRCVLVRTDERFDNLKNEKVSIDVLKKRPDPVAQKLARYFRSRSENNLIIDGVTTHDLPDLDRGKRE